MVTVRPASSDDVEAILELHVASIRAFGPDAYDRIERVGHEPTGPYDVTLDCVRMAKPLR